MLLLEDYQIIYPDGKTLRYDNIHINRGELVGLFGESGCGKTSLLESLLNVGFPGQGTYKKALFTSKSFKCS